MVNRRFDAVFFDLGYTLLDLVPFDGLVSRLCAEHGVGLSPEDVAQLHRGIDREIAAFQPSGRACSLFTAPLDDCRCFWLSLFQRILDASGKGYPGHLPEALYERFTHGESGRIYPDVAATLTALRSAGIRAGVISDWEVWCEAMLKEMELYPLLDFALISGALGMEKPSPHLFRMALERAGVPAERALHVGDDPALGCDAALAMGITPILLDRSGRHPVSSCLRMADLISLPDWVLGGRLGLVQDRIRVWTVSC
ncbi:MAG: HAD family hydrolase [Dehalococcoidia bacterium]